VISNLHALRAIASLMVVLHHARGMIEPHFPSVSNLVVGAAGVDVFFVLSGVVITLSAQAHHVSAGVFLRQRIVRVVPLWWLALVAVMALVSVGLAPLGVQQADVNVVNFLRSMLFIPFERAHGAVMPLLGVGWTLNYEMFFYAIFAILIFLPSDRRSFTLVAVMVALVLLGVVFQPVGVVAQFYTNPILLEFSAGVMLAQLWVSVPAGLDPASRRLARLLGGVLLIIGLAGFVFAAHPDSYSEMMPLRVILWGLPAIACVGGAMALERGGVRLTSNIWAVLGASSYALYLFHCFVLQAVAKFGNSAEVGPIQAVGLFALAIVVSQIVSIGIHLVIERPMTHSIKWFSFRHKPLKHAP